MEKLLSEDERIRKAEEIYYRRKLGDNNIYYKNTESKKQIRHKPIKRMIDIIIISLLAYIVIYAIQNRNYIFTQEFLSSVNQIFCVDLKEKMIQLSGILKDSYENDELSEINTQQSENISNITSTESANENNQEQNTEYIEATLSIAEDISCINQMELDADDIKNNYEIIKPLEGEKTSEFGVRNLNTITVSGYHTGLDIAANTGEDIVAAMSGYVEEVSDYGAYGKHLKIVTDDITTMYAHCSNIYVNEGDIINKGDVIAAVGSTGNSTGPHLHFEIIKNDRYIDPEYLFYYE